MGVDDFDSHFTKRREKSSSFTLLRPKERKLTCKDFLKNEDDSAKAIYDQNYWVKKVENLMKEKKTHLEESNKSRSELYALQDENHDLKNKIRTLTQVIERFKLSDEEATPIIRKSDAKTHNNISTFNQFFSKLEAEIVEDRGSLPLLIGRDRTRDGDNSSDEAADLALGLKDSYIDPSKYSTIPAGVS